MLLWKDETPTVQKVPTAERTACSNPIKAITKSSPRAYSESDQSMPMTRCKF